MLGGALLGVVAAFGMIAPAQAATDWSPQTAGTTTNLNDVAFANPTTGIAVGLGGTILSTTDGGAHWVARKSGITSDLRTVVYGGDACGLGQASTPCYWAGGDDGNILWTNDGGVTWCPQATGVTERINGLAAAGPNDIFAVGTKGTILRSGDGGTNARNCGAAGVYEKQASGTTKDLFDVGVDPAGDTVAVGADGTILRKHGDQGFAAVASPTKADLYGFDGNCTADSLGSCSTYHDWNVGSGGTILRSTEGGPFVAQASGTTQDLQDVFFEDDVHGWIVGDQGTALVTTTGGSPWVSQASGVCADLTSIDKPATVAIAVGDSGTVLSNVGLATATQPNCAPGYWMVGQDGGIFSFGQAAFKGSTGGMKLNQPIVGMAADPDGSGYWFVASDGGVFAFDAPFTGSAGDIKLNQPIVGMAATPSGKGYWLVASDGGIFNYGGANFYQTKTGGAAVAGMTPAADGKGYWIARADGTVAGFGSAKELGGLPKRPNEPIAGIAAVKIS